VDASGQRRDGRIERAGRADRGHAGILSALGWKKSGESPRLRVRLKPNTTMSAKPDTGKSG
jgi:hypothetical protein